MRLSLVTATPATTRSGSGTFVATEQLATGLTRRGHYVTISRPPYLPESPLRFLASRFAFNARLHPRSFADADAIVGFDMDGWRLPGRTRQPFVAYLHGVIADEARFERGRVGLYLRLQARAERQAARRADLVLATSEYSRARITTLYGVPPAKIAIVAPGIDLAAWDAFLAGSPREPRDLPTILSVAHMYPRKNLPALINATALLRRDLDVRVRLVGIGPEHPRLIALARKAGVHDVIDFLGHVSRQALAREYRSCDVFCLPSLQEGFGLVYIEAMAAGKPVVALASSSTPEIVTDGVNGRLASPGDDAALALHLGELLRDSALRERMGRAGRAQAQRFTTDRMVERFVEAIAPLTGTGGGTTLPSPLTT